jgi:hypothetical protein
MIFFWLLLSIAKYAGLYGMFLLILLLPAYLRYLLDILDARANGRQPEAPTADMFSLVDSAWTLFPAVPIALLLWFSYFIAPFAAGSGAARVLLAHLPAIAFVLIMPAFLTVLTMTHSPAASLNPLTIVTVIRRNLPGYLFIPLLTALVSVGLFGLKHAGVPPWLMDLGESYRLFLFCSLTGAVMYKSAMYLQVDIPDSVEPEVAELDRKLLAERKTVASHAYGFISRGNRDGGLMHVQQSIDQEADVDGAYQWYFDEMLRWGSSDAVLYFAQSYLGRLLRLEQEAAAIRLLTRCLYRDSRFRPLEQDRRMVAELLRKNRRSDLLAELQSQASLFIDSSS